MCGLQGSSAAISAAGEAGVSDGSQQSHSSGGNSSPCCIHVHCIAGNTSPSWEFHKLIQTIMVYIGNEVQL